MAEGKASGVQKDGRKGKDAASCKAPSWREYVRGLQENIGYTFRNHDLLCIALTHASYRSPAGKSEEERNNQRMEFLGDAVLELCISRLLYDKHPDKDEGWMTRMRSLMVREDALYQVAVTVSLGEYLRMSPSEERNNGRDKPSILSDGMEALICAIYLDGGWQPAADFILRLVPQAVDETAVQHTRDPKTRLQEWLQRDGNVDIRYSIVGEKGQAHNMHFEAEVQVEGKVLGWGEGKSKKEAEQMAAAQALDMLQKKE